MTNNKSEGKSIFQWGIARKFIIYILLFSAAITLVLTTIQLYMDYRYGVDSIKKSALQIEASYLDGVINSLWLSDNQLLQMQLDGMLKLSDMQYVDVVHNTETIAMAGEFQDTHVITKDFSLSYTYNNKTISLGKLRVVYSLNGLYNRLKNKAIVILILQSIKTFMVSGFIFFIFYLLVARHLHAIANYARSLDLKTLGKPFLLKRNHKKSDKDEFDMLVTAVNEMRINLDNSYHQLHGEIANRLQVENELRTSNERFFTVLNSIDATIYVADLETHEILFMNKHMIESFDRDMTGEICWKVFRGESGPCTHCSNDQLIDKNGQPTDVYTWQDQNPITGKWYVNYDRAIEWTDGHLVKLQIATDITSFKKMEDQLQQAQKMESIGTLAGGIAHDFNNILFPILGHTEMLLEDVSEDSPFKKSLNEIFTSALRAKDLVKQILTFSRQENSELKLIKMQPIIKEVLKLIRSTIPTTIEIKQDIKSDCGVIKADPTQIHQIIMNITTNAYHAMADTGGELIVSLKEMELGAFDLINPDMKPGAYACLTIADKGIGMDKGLVQKIFDPFFTTKEKGKGTGMGLSVVHGIIKNMNGGIQVNSKPGKGTQFHVYLPVEKSLSEEEVTNSKAQIQGGNEQILLVDDEKAILTMEKKVLERLGYHVTSRNSSIEALEVFRAEPDKFDMVITDMQMPNMPGDKLSAELIKIRPDIPVLLCTGFSETMSEEKATSQGINGLVFKPIVMKDLASKIREVLFKT